MQSVHDLIHHTGHKRDLEVLNMLINFQNKKKL